MDENEDLLPTLTTTTILVRVLRPVTSGQPRLANDGTGIIPRTAGTTSAAASPSPHHFVPNDENDILSFVIVYPLDDPLKINEVIQRVERDELVEGGMYLAVVARNIPLSPPPPGSSS